MSITDEGHYGPKQLNLLKTVWGGILLSHGLCINITPLTHQTKFGLLDWLYADI